mgnify:CR=1 FL=1
MLDLQLAVVLGAVAASGAPDLGDLQPSAARQMYRQIFASGDLPLADVTVEDRHIDGPGGRLALRAYTPRGEAGPRGAVLYCHGGGFVVGDLDIYDATCRTLCHDSGCIVVAVDYRLAPEHRFPAAVDDCQAALRWLAAHAAQLGIEHVAHPTRQTDGDAPRVRVRNECAHQYRFIAHHQPHNLADHRPPFSRRLQKHKVIDRP